jgi:hypothetical protein
MRALLALAPILAACTGAGAPAANDPAAVVSVVVRTQAADLRSAWPGRGCVQRQIDGRAFDDTRREVANMANPDYNGNLTQAKADEVRAAMSAPIYRWRHVGENGRLGSKRTLDRDLAHSLDLAAGEIIRKTPEPARVKSIDPNAPGGVPFCANGTKQPYLSVSAPAFSGDFAFVETSFVCGGLCGNGLLYALRRTRSGWEIAGAANTWIS